MEGGSPPFGTGAAAVGSIWARFLLRNIALGLFEVGNANAGAGDADVELGSSGFDAGGGGGSGGVLVVAPKRAMLVADDIGGASSNMFVGCLVSIALLEGVGSGRGEEHAAAAPAGKSDAA
jgi:hypothetical protein